MGLDSPHSSNIGFFARVQMGIMASIRHPNVVLFMGVCLEPPCIVTEWCGRGSLYDVLAKGRRNRNLAAQLDWPRRLGMALDAAKVRQAC
jgi:hypothetical protein